MSLQTLSSEKTGKDAQRQISDFLRIKIKKYAFSLSEDLVCFPPQKTNGWKMANKKEVEFKERWVHLCVPVHARSLAEQQP